MEFFVMMELCFHDCMCLSKLTELYAKKGDFTACELCLNNPAFQKDKDILSSYRFLHVHCIPDVSVVPPPTLAFVKSRYLAM